MKERQAGTAAVLRKAVPATLPVMAGYIFLGIAYGVTMKERGFAAVWTALSSLLVYAGSMQFAMIGLLGGAFSPLSAALMTLLVNGRHLFYGLSMLEPYGKVKRFKPYLIFALTDETYSLVVRPVPDGLNPDRWYACVSLLDQIYWLTGSILGALLGQVLPFDLTGIDFAMTALFTAIFTEQCTDAYRLFKAGKLSAFDALFPALLGVCATLICLLAAGSGAFMLWAMAAMMLFFFADYLAAGRKEAQRS